MLKLFIGKNGNKRGGGGWPHDGDTRSRSILKNKEARGTDSELLLQETTSLGANVSRKLVPNKIKSAFVNVLKIKLIILTTT